MNVIIVAGARPNFVKIAPLIQEIEKRQKLKVNISYNLIHTGQHYDNNLSDSFFKELMIPKPCFNLNVLSGTHAEQTGEIMKGFEKILNIVRSELVIVVGDVTSTMACAIVAKKANVEVAHIEAGIRSGDMSMPEEINRIVTDSITDYFFTTSEFANETLLKNGVPKNKIFFVGNVMIDTLLKNIHRLKKPMIWDKLCLSKGKYYVLTLHRPSNVDSLNIFSRLLKIIIENAQNIPIIFPVHPRTLKILKEADLIFDNLHFIPPLNYLSFLYLVKYSKAVLTDSGGITEEASILDVPCITFRDNTERPETCELGTNVLVGNDTGKINSAFKKLLSGNWKRAQDIPKWDGKASIRIIDQIVSLDEQ